MHRSHSTFFQLVTLASQTGRKLDGTIPSSITEQAKVVYESINKHLAAAGATPGTLCVCIPIIVLREKEYEEGISW